MKQKISIIIIIIQFSILNSQFCPAQTIDLQTCITKGLENNFAIKLVRNSQRVSDNNFSAGNAGMLPTLDLNASYAGTLNDIDQFPADGNEKIANKGVNNTGLDVGLSLNWTVFDGFKMFAAYDKLKELQQKGELNTRLSIENFVANVSAEYYNFVRQNIRLDNLKSAVRLSKERLRIVEARYNIGSMSRLDLQQAKVDFNADSSKLILQKETLFTSRVKLNQLMAETDVEQERAPADSVINFNSLFEKNAIWNDVLQQNTTLLLSEKDRTISVKDLRAAQSGNYPYLKLSAGYGYTDNRYENSAYRQQNTLGMKYGVTLGFNLFDGFNRLREQRNARIAVENREIELEELRLALQSDFANIWMAYRNNMELVSLERENLNSAIENYDIAIERYKLGDLSGIELREAQNSLLEAEERLLQAQYNTKLCEISLLQISGTLVK
ncbi:MAG: TolC family protein [Paludibacter sp.]|jgi:outer membrane protein TolC|nr:TolC family protein [Paludibacter sp.]